MSSQWFFSRQGTRTGPVTSERLKALAETGQVAPSDLAWKEGMPEWVPVGTLDGLFPEPPPIPTDRPTPPPEPSPKTPPPFDGKPSIAGRLKAAGRTAGLTAQRTKLTTVTMPSAYRSLGKHLLQAGNFRASYPDLFKQLDALVAEKQLLKEAAESRPVAEGFTGKAKATALGAKELAQAKALDLRIAQALGRLGERAFADQADQSGPADLVRPIANAAAQVRALDEQMEGIGTELHTAAPEAGRKSRRRLTERPVVVGLLLVFFFPVGLWLVWKHSNWTPIRKLTITAVTVIVVVIATASYAHQSAKAHADLAQADSLWIGGKTHEAADAYAAVVDDDLDFLSEADKSRAFSRLIDGRVASGGPEAGRPVVQRAMSLGIALSLATTEANRLNASITDEQQRQQAARQQVAVDASRGANHPPETALPKAANPIRQIRIGMSQAQVESILGEPTSRQTDMEGRLLFMTYGSDPAHADKVFFATDGHPTGAVTMVSFDGLDGGSIQANP